MFFKTTFKILFNLSSHHTDKASIITREGFLRKNIVAVLRTFSLKINKLPIFSEITQE